jgi:hypothetical protein
MKVRFSYLALPLVLWVTGCASTTAVIPAASSKSSFDNAAYSGETVTLATPTPGAETYRIFQQGATGFVSVANVRDGVDEIATRHCARSSKAARPLQETTSKPPHILGNYPRVEWVFECVDHAKAAGNPPPGPDRLEQIERLKKLLDSGALTKDEFEREKAKVLAAPG